MGDTKGQSSIAGKKTFEERLLGPASVAGTTLDLLGAIKGAKTAKEAAKYRIRTARFNQKALAEQALQTVASGGLQAAQQEGKALGAASGQDLALSAQGVSLSSREAMLQRLSNVSLGRMDADAIRHGATREAFGLQSQAEGMLAEAYMQSAAELAAQQGSILKSGLNVGKSILNLLPGA